MTFPAQIGMHVAAALAVIGAVWLVWAVLRMLLKTRPSVTGGGKSAGSSARPRPWRRAAKAEGLAGPEAADTVPDGGALPRPSSGTTWACSRCGSPGRHDEWCYRPRRLVSACVHCPQMGDGSHAPWCKADPIDRHIDTAAAILQPDAPHLPFSELDAAVPSKPISEEEDRKWLGIVAGYRFTAAPVVPGGEQA